jgi:hypothetical protein
LAINHKGSRRVVVDDVAYRWRIRRKPSHAQASEYSPLLVAISLDEAPGATLVIEANGQRPDALHLSLTTITPATIAAAIRSAIAAGWRSSEPGSPFRFRLESGPTPTDRHASH